MHVTCQMAQCSKQGSGGSTSQTSDQERDPTSRNHGKCWWNPPKASLWCFATDTNKVQVMSVVRKEHLPFMCGLVWILCCIFYWDEMWGRRLFWLFNSCPSHLGAHLCSMCIVLFFFLSFFFFTKAIALRHCQLFCAHWLCPLSSCNYMLTSWCWDEDSMIIWVEPCSAVKSSSDIVHLNL